MTLPLALKIKYNQKSMRVHIRSALMPQYSICGRRIVEGYFKARRGPGADACGICLRRFRSTLKENKATMEKKNV